MSAEGVDQNIDLALMIFIVKPTSRSLFISSVPPTHRSLELHMAWSVNIPCQSSLQLQYVCLSMVTKAFLFYIQCPTVSWTEVTRRLEWPEGNGPHFFMGLTPPRQKVTTAQQGCWCWIVSNPVHVCTHVWVCFQTCCWQVLWPIIAHNCIHLWERLR